MKNEQALSPGNTPWTGRFAWQRAVRVLLWLALGVLLYLVIYDFYTGAVLNHNAPSLRSKRFLIFLITIPFQLAGYGYGLWLAWSGRKPDRLRAALRAFRARVPLALRALLGLVFLAFPAWLFMFTRAGFYPMGFWSRIGFILAGALVCALLTLEELPPLSWALCYAGLALAGGSLYVAASNLNRVVTYPFSLSWSEGNRIWDYSMLFPGARYILPDGAKSRTLTSAGRQFLWGLPLLIPNLSLWAFRLWDALTWIIPPMALGALAIARPPVKHAFVWQAGFALWSFVFLTQGPIYAPLVICAILAILAARSRSLPLGILLVMVAGYYAQVSRWTWAYAPGLWAGMLALFQIERPSLRPANWKALGRPVLLGLAGYIGGQYVRLLLLWVLRGFTTQLKLSAIVDPTSAVAYQPLLWDRLLPNSTFLPGILLGMIWAGLPLIVLLVFLWKKGIWRMNWMQGLAALGISLAFMIVGVVASVKIGGGSNLHNLDMFWVTLLLLAGLAMRDLLTRRSSVSAVTASLPLTLLLIVAMIFPVTYNAPYGTPLSLPINAKTREALVDVRNAVKKAQANGGDVLFIDQRQLLTFGYVPQVPLVIEYEKKLMMDNAMADNSKYFQALYQDLKNHRFSYIITEPIHATYITSEDRTFPDENNSWVKWVAEPLLKYYRPVGTHKEVGVQILAPKP